MNNECGNTIKSTCGKRSNAKCTDFDGTLAANTTITSTCVDVEQAITDVNLLIDRVFDAIVLSNLDGGCLTIPTGTKVNEMFQIMINSICSQQDTIAAQSVMITTMQGQISDLQTNQCPPTE